MFCPCNQQGCPLNGSWLIWQSWGDCSVSCESGIQVRRRVCIPPLHAGDPCRGDYKETRPCQRSYCPGKAIELGWRGRNHAWNEFRACLSFVNKSRVICLVGVKYWPVNSTIIILFIPTCQSEEKQQKLNFKVTCGTCNSYNNVYCARFLYTVHVGQNLALTIRATRIFSSGYNS